MIASPSIARKCLALNVARGSLWRSAIAAVMASIRSFRAIGCKPSNGLLSGHRLRPAK